MKRLLAMLMLIAALPLNAIGATPATYKDGTLLRGDKHPGVFIIWHNRKVPLRTPEMFDSRGFKADQIVWVPQAAMDAIPNAPLRAKSNYAVYAVNAFGWRRHIINPAVLNAYGWKADDVYALEDAELASYPDTDLVMKEGTDRVLSIAKKQFVAPFNQVNTTGRNNESVHVINATDVAEYASKVVATGLDVPWAIAFLPDGDMLVTERPGTLNRIGSKPKTYEIPKVAGAGEGGLMGIALHPDYASNKFVYLYYTTNDPQRNRITRFRLDDTALTLDKVILDNIPSAIYHDGGQLAFGPDKLLYVVTGDASSPNLAPDLASLAGKTLRLTDEGEAAPGNPFNSMVWSYGHRNAQGIAWDAQGRLWETEHGRSGASSGYDELNLIQKGKNYGWPDSQGATVRAGTVAPVKYSSATTTWAPSGLAYVNGTLFFAGLKGESLYSTFVNADGTTSAISQHLKGTYGRLRAVVLGPDGMLYLTTSNRDARGTVRSGDDKIIKVAPDFLK